MYLFFAIAFLLTFFFSVCFRSRKITREICRMPREEKDGLLTKLFQSSGYSYRPSKDHFSACFSPDLPADRGFGRRIFPDRITDCPHLFFDHLKVYFVYLEDTWTIEFFKGQYGFAAWGEIGIRQVNGVLHNAVRPDAPFPDADREQPPESSFSLYAGKERLIRLSDGRSRLAGFKTVRFFAPLKLSMQVSLSFPSHPMAMAFSEGLVATGYACDDVCVCDDTVTFTFGAPAAVPGIFGRVKKKAALFAGHFWYRACCFTTRRLSCLSDKILYLYYDLPFLFYKAVPVRKRT